MTFGKLVAHIAQTNTVICSIIGAMPVDVEVMKLADTAPKDTLVAAMKQSFSLLHRGARQGHRRPTWGGSDLDGAAQRAVARRRDDHHHQRLGGPLLHSGQLSQTERHSAPDGAAAQEWPLSSIFEGKTRCWVMYPLPNQPVVPAV